MAEATQLQMFKEIYEARLEAGTWKSDISGKPLPKQNEAFWVWSFSHILPRSTFPKYKLNPDNVCLMTSAEHTLYENFTEASKRKALYTIYQRNWEVLFAKRDLLKQKYFEERNTIKP